MSDQDFFFDEDEKPAEKSADKPARKSAAPAKPAAAASAGIGEQSVSMTVAALIGVVTLLLGVIIGLFVAPDDGKVAAPTATGAAQTGAAQPLSEDQIQQGLPPNHPTIPQEMTGGIDTTGTPESGTTTPTE